MPAFLTSEWLREAAELAHVLPKKPGLSATLQWHVDGEGRRPDVIFYLVMEDGQPVELGVGHAKAADVSLFSTYRKEIEILRMRRDLGDMLRTGDIGLSGDVTKALSLEPVLKSHEFRQWRKALAAITD